MTSSIPGFNSDTRPDRKMMVFSNVRRKLPNKGRLLLWKPLAKKNQMNKSYFE